MQAKHPLWFAALACGMLAAGAAQASEQIATKAGCTVCHAVEKKADKKMVGPYYKDVAAKYRARADAVAYLSGQVRKGSKGVWGAVPMLPTAPDKLSDADLKTVITWIMKTPG